MARTKQVQAYSIESAAEGGLGQRQAILQLKAAGLVARPCGTCFVGHVGVEVEGGKRQQRRASTILFGRF